MTLAWQATLPIRTYSEANSREHWAAKRKRRLKQASALQSAWAKESPCIKDPESCEIQIWLTRIAPRSLDSSDNLPASFKHLLDTLCDLILPGHKPGRADGKLNIMTIYGQRKGAPKEYAVEIKIYINELVEDEDKDSNSSGTLQNNVPNINTQHHLSVGLPCTLDQ